MLVMGVRASRQRAVDGSYRPVVWQFQRVCDRRARRADVRSWRQAEVSRARARL